MTVKSFFRQELEHLKAQWIGQRNTNQMQAIIQSDVTQLLNELMRRGLIHFAPEFEVIDMRDSSDNRLIINFSFIQFEQAFGFPQNELYEDTPDEIFKDILRNG